MSDVAVEDDFRDGFFFVRIERDGRALLLAVTLCDACHAIVPIGRLSDHQRHLHPVVR